jgi:uracil-DNA glycosylase family 4
VGLLKNLTPGVYGRRISMAERAEAFMQAKARGTMSFATEEEAAAYFLEGAEEKWSSCQRCPLGAGRTKLVYGEGHPQPELLIVGEAPGESEDLSGVPFVGEAGIILRRSLRSAKVGLADVTTYIANTVACRPPKNRKPEKTEREACLPRLLELVRILRPRVILLLGGTAGLWFGIREVGANRGIVPRSSWPALGDALARLRAVILTYHPSYILHQDKKARKATAFAEFVGDLILTRRAVEKVRRLEAEELARNGPAVLTYTPLGETAGADRV